MKHGWFAVCAVLALVGTAAGCGSSRGTGRGPTPVVVVRDDDRDVRGPRSLRIPPGHYPPPGECRLWYPGRPPGQQPPPVRCSRLRGALGRGAFILYNNRAWDADYDWRRHERRNPGTVPRVILELVIR